MVLVITGKADGHVEPVVRHLEAAGVPWVRLNTEDAATNLSVTVERWNGDGYGVVRLERAGSGWRVDGAARPDLDGAEEPDLSVTPFCNTLPIRRILGSPHASVTVDVAYVNGKDLTVARSRQRYDRQGSGSIRYADLGLFPGFEADLDVPVLDVNGHDGGPFHAVFIRAPVVERAGEKVEILASIGDRPVLARQGAVLVSSFHPELAADGRLHRYFLEEVA